eukprot:1438608-Heterocapsa_arctica.AAC.1
MHRSSVSRFWNFTLDSGSSFTSLLDLHAVDHLQNLAGALEVLVFTTFDDSASCSHSSMDFSSHVIASRP